MNRDVERQNWLYESNDDDIELIKSFCEGNKAAFNRLVLKYQDPIMNLCVRYLGNCTDGEDAAQETFVKIFKNLSKFKGDALFSTWLYRIALNTCKNYRRSWWSRLKQKAVNLDAPVETEDSEYTPEIGDDRLSPERDLNRHRLADTIQAALATLLPKHKELIIMRDIQGMSYEEISRTLGISLGTVKSRLVRARSAMQEQLRGTVNEY
jgi:RNA polymerase sigma-70 factor (ECF subfamily)